MFYSPSRKFCYVRAPKTGSSSMMLWLVSQIKEDDITIGTDDHDPTLAIKHQRTNAVGHMPVGRIKEIIGPRQFEESFSFVFVRHPFEIAMSAYFGHPNEMRAGDFFSFSDWAKRCKNKRLSWAMFGNDGGEVLVNKIYRFDKYAEAVDDLKDRFNLEGRPPHIRKSEKKRDWRDFIKGETKDILLEFYSKEFEYFGWDTE